MSPLGALFFVFAVAGFLTSWTLRNNPKNRTQALTLVTIVFWGWVDLRSLVVLVLVASWVVFVARRLQRTDNPGERRRLQRVGVGAVVLLLLGWRAVPTLLETLEQIGVIHVWRGSFWQPIGVAILAIQAVSVVIDVARRDSEVPTWSESLLLCGFFPRAIAGPVVRSNRFIVELRQCWDGVVPMEKIAVLVMGAAVKKYVFAETLTNFTARVTAVRNVEGVFDMLMSELAAVLAFVCDLSAYTDLAIAAALLCGIKLPPNFNAPFSGWTVGEFMRRWHMSISGFFRDYVLVALRGNSRSSTRLFLAVCGTFQLIALWHNFSLTTMIWGALIGVPVAFEAVKEKRRAERREPRKPAPTGVVRWSRALCVTAYFALVSPWFPADDVSVLWSLHVNNFFHAWDATQITTWWVVLVVVLAWLTGAGLFSRLSHVVERLLSRAPAVLVGTTVALFVTFMAGLSSNGVPTFLYQSL